MPIYLKNLIILIAILLINGCYKETKIPQQIFDDICYFNPFEVKNNDDILKNYIELYTTHKQNLILLETLKTLNKPP